MSDLEAAIDFAPTIVFFGVVNIHCLMICNITIVRGQPIGGLISPSAQRPLPPVVLHNVLRSHTCINRYSKH